MSQNATSSWGGRRKMPYAFNEHGVLMLSSVLSSKRAIQVNIQIMRIYAKLRGIVIDQKDILIKLEQIERTVDKHNQDIMVVFAYLKELLNPQQELTRKIGFSQKATF